MVNAILDETEVKSISFFDNESSLTKATNEKSNLQSKEYFER